MRLLVTALRKLAKLSAGMAMVTSPGRGYTAAGQPVIRVGVGSCKSATTAVPNRKTERALPPSRGKPPPCQSPDTNRSLHFPPTVNQGEHFRYLALTTSIWSLPSTCETGSRGASVCVFDQLWSAIL